MNGKATCTGLCHGLGMDRAGVAMDGKLYVLGGRGNRAVNVYDPQTSRWTRMSAAVPSGSIVRVAVTS